MTKTSFFALFLSALLFIPIAEAKTTKTPNAKTAKTATEAVPLKNFLAPWEKMSEKQKKAIMEILDCDIETCNHPSTAFYLVDLNDDGIKDLIVYNIGGSRMCICLDAYLGTRLGFSKKGITIDCGFCSVPQRESSFEDSPLEDYPRLFLEFYVSNSKHNNMRDFLVLERNMDDGRHVDVNILKCTWYDDKQNKRKYLTYFYSN